MRSSIVLMECALHCQTRCLQTLASKSRLLYSQMTTEPQLTYQHIEFWTRGNAPVDETLMSNVDRLSKICQHLFHKHRSTLIKLEDLQYGDYRRHPEKSFRVKATAPLAPVLCLDRYPHLLSGLPHSIPSLSFEDDVQCSEGALMVRLQTIRDDYERIAKLRSQCMDAARDSKLILRVMISHDSPPSEKIDSELAKENINAFERHGGISKGTTYCFNVKCNQAVFSALQKHGYIGPEFAGRIPYQMTIGCFTETGGCVCPNK